MTTRLWIALMVSLSLLSSTSIVGAGEPCCSVVANAAPSKAGWAG